jgi:thioesterase domain-containing protein
MTLARGSEVLAADLRAYLHAHIPLSAAMQVEVLAADPDSITLAAPLAPNINHRETAFGGSASALAILASWSLLHGRLQAAGTAVRLVIQRNEMEYLRPIVGDFTARATLADADSWPTFAATLARRGRARIIVAAELACAEDIVGRFTGEFVAIAPG